MEEDEDDDIYAPTDAVEVVEQNIPAVARSEKKGDDLDEGEEEGEEIEEDSSDSDIDIITELKEGGKVETLQSQRVNVIKQSSVGTATPDPISKPLQSPATGQEAPTKSPASRLGTTYPAIKISKIDVEARPIYEPNGKPITEVDMDADFPEDDKPWRRPGTDMTDYFNYGFDEFTWASYCLKQESLRKEVADSKKQMEEMQSFLAMPGAIPALPGQPGSALPALASMAGPGDIPAEWQQMMAQMMSQGVDPTQMDPAMFMQQMMQGNQASTNGAQGQSFATQNFGQQQQNQSQMSFGYGNGAGTSGGGAGGGAGRAQGGRGQSRRNW